MLKLTTKLMNMFSYYITSLQHTLLLVINITISIVILIQYTKCTRSGTFIDIQVYIYTLGCSYFIGCPQRQMDVK